MRTPLTRFESGPSSVALLTPRDDARAGIHTYSASGTRLPLRHCMTQNPRIEPGQIRAAPNVSASSVCLAKATALGWALEAPCDRQSGPVDIRIDDLEPRKTRYNEQLKGLRTGLNSSARGSGGGLRIKKWGGR